MDLSNEEKANKIRGFRSVLSNDNDSAEAKQHAREQLKAFGVSDIDDESKTSSEQHKDPTHVVAGLKGAVHNSNNTTEGQAEAEKKLHDLQPELEGKDPSHVAGGLKGAMHNSNVSAGAQQEAEKKLHAM